MSNTLTETATAGEDVVRAIGDLNGTTEAAALAATEVAIDHEEIKGWIKTIAELVMSIIK